MEQIQNLKIMVVKKKLPCRGDVSVLSNRICRALGGFSMTRHCVFSANIKHTLILFANSKD